MRLKHLTLLAFATALLLSGCSAGRSMSGAPQVASSQERPVASGYDHDPPAPPHSRVAIQPAPVPPASSPTQIRGISFLRILGHHQSQCAEEPCLARANVNCSTFNDTCAPEGCSDGCGDACHEYCRPSWASRCMSALKDKCTRKSDCAEECTQEPVCAAPAPVECDACAEPACGETSCCQPWYRKLRLPKFNRTCSRDKCGEECCTSENECCTDEGCDDECHHRSLLACLVDSTLQNPLCRLKPRFGALCRPGCRQECGECGDEGCTDRHGCGNQSSRSEHCRSASPLADCLAEDPFAHQHHAHPAQDQPPVVPDAPGVPATPIGPAGNDESAPQYEQPTKVPPAPGAAAGQLTPPPPVPPTPGEQAYVQPQIWPKLKAGENVQQPAAATTVRRTTASQHVWHY